MSKQSGSTSISRRYAKALFELAGASNAVDAVLKNVEGLQAACGNGHFRTIMNNPLLGKAVQMRAVAALKTPLGLHALTQQFLNTLVENRRLALLPAALDYFVELARAARGESLVVVTSAKKLDDAARRTLHAALEKKLGKIVLHEQTDTSLLAGVVIRKGSHLLDASLKGRLNKLRIALN
jgi:F-type H+-transporting ATPase subunit delta